MDIDTSAILAPIVINGHTVKNRLSVAPMTRITATQDGRATEAMTRYYEVSRGVASGRSSPNPIANIKETELVM